MRKEITLVELTGLGINAKPSTGEIFVHGEKVIPTIFKTKKGYTYPQIVVYDPKRWTMKRYGNRPIMANRIIWAFAYDVCPADIFIKAKNGDIFDLRIENLYSVPVRGPRE